MKNHINAKFINKAESFQHNVQNTLYEYVHIILYISISKISKIHKWTWILKRLFHGIAKILKQQPSQVAFLLINYSIVCSKVVRIQSQLI